MSLLQSFKGDRPPPAAAHFKSQPLFLSSYDSLSLSNSRFLPVLSCSPSLLALVVVGIVGNLSPSLCLRPLPLVTSQPVAPLTEASGLARAHGISRMDAPSCLIGRRAERCPHIRAEAGGTVIKVGGEDDNKVCDIVDCLSEE